MTRIVLDCSAALALVLDDEADARSDALYRVVAASDIVVPTIWPVELANGLRTAFRRGRLRRNDVAMALDLFVELDIVVDTTAPVHAELVDAALQFDLTAYDAAYLLLARREHLPLATLDKKLAAAAQGAGVRLTSWNSQ